MTKDGLLWVCSKMGLLAIHGQKPVPPQNDQGQTQVGSKQEVKQGVGGPTLVGTEDQVKKDVVGQTHGVQRGRKKSHEPRWYDAGGQTIEKT